MVKNPIMDSERYCDFRTDYQESVRMKRQVNQFRRKVAEWNLRAFLKKKKNYAELSIRGGAVPISIVSAARYSMPRTPFIIPGAMQL
jgi:hypothetical protein